MKNSFQNIPKELRERRQWVCWQLVDRDGRPTKIPINAKTGRAASTTDSKTWCDFETAVSRAPSYSGIGFVFSNNDPYTGIDIDKRQDQDLIRWLDSYTEVSHSGAGAHIIVRGKFRDAGRRMENLEFYSSGRYFVMTGNVINDKPVEDRQEQLEQIYDSMFSDELPPAPKVSYEPEAGYDPVEHARESAQGGKFTALFAGDWSAYPSQSEADAALLSMLRFWCRGDKDWSFRLFRGSGLMRPKFEREDYREKTWAKIATGEVYSERDREEVPDIDITPFIARHKSEPWGLVSNEQVLEAIKDTALEELVKCFGAYFSPELPLEITLTKALAIAGCAMSQPYEAWVAGENSKSKAGGLSEYIDKEPVGVELSKVKINTAGGQTCNIYSIIAADSASGKDAGGLLGYLARELGWFIGQAGSAEGLADVLATRERGAGLLQIGEMKNWLTEKHWQHQATSFLTEAFNAGQFCHQFSNRKDGIISSRISKYCYPSIVCYVQPQVFAKLTNQTDVDSGFLGRFILSRCPPDYTGDPVCGDLEWVKSNALEAVKCFTVKEGLVEFDTGYFPELRREFRDYAAPHKAHWARLVNEYGPRFAAILSADDTSPFLCINDRALKGAEMLVRWYFAQACRLYKDIGQTDFDRLLDTILCKIEKAPGKKITMSDIGKTVTNVDKSARIRAIEELIDRRKIVELKGKGGRSFKIAE